MQSVEEVYATIGREVRLLAGEIVNAGEGHGRVLAQEVVMKGDSPPFDRSQLDGFAVRSADAMAGAKLQLVGKQEAGAAVWQGKVEQGQCVAINTGGVFPAGADAVLMVEYSKAAGEVVQVMRSVEKGHGVQRRGSDATAGQEILAAGEKLGSAQVAAAVSAGAREVKVVRRVKVAVLTTGDELIDPGTKGQGDKGTGMIWNSNGPMLLGLVRDALGAAGEILDLGTCGDEERALRERLGRGLMEADVLVVTGGMSMGTKDLVPVVLKELGVAFHVEKVRMKPGKPFVFGTLGQGNRREGDGSEGGARKYVAGLPGNPVSAFVTFQLFVREILGKLCGVKQERLVGAEAGSVFEANGEREFYQPCVLRRRGSVLVAEVLKWRGSGDVFSLARAQGLVKRAVGAGRVELGEQVEVVVL